MDCNKSDTVKEGDYVIIQKQNFTKLHQISGKSGVMLGKDKLNLSEAIGKPTWAVYKMIPTRSNKREFQLQIAERVENVTDSVFRDAVCGQDNRNIIGDNKSQLLSSEEISGLRDSGLSSTGIVTALIENSLSFKKKTEYSQEKYLKKKEKKYHEFITIRKPTLRILAEVLFARDQFKILGLRYDTLSQIISSVNIQPGANYLLYERGTQGLVGAAMLNYVAENTTIINLTSGIHPQKQAILAMNFPVSKTKCYVSVKILSLLDHLKSDTQSLSFQNDSLKEDITRKIDSSCENLSEINSLPNNDKCEESVKCVTDTDILVPPDCLLDVETKKRKLDVEMNDDETRKRPKWMDELARAVDILKNQKVDGLVIATKEYPLEILDSFLQYIKPSRPLVIFSTFREPLVELYIDLKKRKNVLNMHLSETWLRNYQVLPDRTHPHVNMSPASGYLLTATIVSL